MPARSDRPSPPARMVELLAVRKRELLDHGVELTRSEFDAAWNDAWVIMTAERAWAHATEHRRGSRIAMVSTRSEYRAAFLDQPTAFSTLAVGLTTAGKRLRVTVTTDDLPTVILGAIGQGYLADHDAERPGGIAA